MEENSRKLDQLRKSELNTAEMQHDIDSKKREIDTKLSKVEAKEKASIKREMDWLSHHTDMKSLVEELEKSKRELEESASVHKGELANLKQKWDSTIESLQDVKPFISSQKAELNRLVKGDIRALKEKEHELLGMVDELEKDRRRLEREEKLVTARLRELERTRVGVENVNKALVEREREAKKIIAFAEKARQLKVDVPRLSREAVQLRREISVLRKAAEKYGAMPRAVRVKAVHLKARRISPAAPEVRQRFEVREKPVAAARSEVTRDELMEMISGAKASIEAHDVSSAMRILEDLESAARRMGEEDRRQLSYEIRDLRTIIKLAML